MGVDKLVKNLHENLDKVDLKNATARCHRIESLLGKLKKKEKKLKKKLAIEKNKTKRKSLALEIRIVSLELKKGNKRCKELKEKRDRMQKHSKRAH